MKKHSVNTLLLCIALVFSLALLLALLYYRFSDSASDGLPQKQDKSLYTPAQELPPSLEDTLPASGAVGQPPFEDLPALTELEALLDGSLSGLDGTWDVYVERLSDGAACSARSASEPSGPMVSASLIKLFIMGAVYERVRDGALDGDEVEGALRSMITVSDNDAANELTLLLGGGDEKLGMEAVNRFAEGVGCPDTEMNRLMLADNGLQNYTTAADCALLLRLIYGLRCVSPEYDEEMLELLKAQKRTSKIPAGLPEGVVCANKTGELSGLSECDAAIVFAPGGAYILCVLSEPEDNAATIDAIVGLSRAVYGFFEA